MNSVTTGAILRTLRKEADLSAQDVSAILRNKYSIELSSRTLFRYEAGCSIPNITHFLALCTIYHCHDILYTFGYRDEKSVPSGLSFEERQIINKYRNLPILEKNIILGALGIKKERVLPRIALLNGRGRLLLWISQMHRTLGHYVLKKKRFHYQCSKTFYLPTLY